MFKSVCFVCLCLMVVACAPKKPEPCETQIVNGRSIIVPPEFDIVPQK